MNRFTNKVVLVTGSSRGIGAATAKRFANEGAYVIINYFKDEVGANNTRDSIVSSGGKAEVIQADVGDEVSVKSMVDQIIKENGSIDFLINNAGIVYDIPFKDKTSEQWQRTFDVNLNGIYYCTKYAMPYLSDGGSIVNISSTNGIDTFHPDSIDYDISKAGVIMFTKAMARDLAPKIRINCVAPGWCDTNINKDLPKDYVKNESSKIAMGRFGKPEEIASVVAFLCSEDAVFMTGAVLVVDGGYGGAV